MLRIVTAVVDFDFGMAISMISKSSFDINDASSLLSAMPPWFDNADRAYVVDARIADAKQAATAARKTALYEKECRMRLYRGKINPDQFEPYQ
jgi:hypothetical protein